MSDIITRGIAKGLRMTEQRRVVARVIASADDHPDVEELYRRAIELDPWLAIAYTNLGNVCFRRGDEEGAETFYRKALEIEAAQPEAQYNLGYVMLERGHAAEAVTFFKGAIAASPPTPALSCRRIDGQPRSNLPVRARARPVAARCPA